MKVAKVSKRFLKKFKNDIDSDVTLRNLSGGKIKKLYRKAVQSVTNDELRKYLQDSERQQLTKILERQNDDQACFPYCCYAGTAALDTTLLSSSNAGKTAQICDLYLKRHLEKSDTDLDVVFRNFKSYQSVKSLDTKFLHRVTLSAQHVSPGVFIQVLLRYVGTLGEETEKALHDGVKESIRVINEETLSLLYFFHSRYRSYQDGEKEPIKARYMDCIAAILSSYVDQYLVISRNEGDQKKRSARLCCVFAHFLGPSTPYFLDVFLQTTSLTTSDSTLVLGALSQTLMHLEAGSSPETFTKYVALVRKLTNIFAPVTMIAVKQRCRMVPAPKSYIKWLKRRNASLMSQLPFSKKDSGTAITRYILCEASEPVVESLLDAVTCAETNKKSSVEEHVKESRPLDKEPTFFFDTKKSGYPGQISTTAPGDVDDEMYPGLATAAESRTVGELEGALFHAADVEEDSVSCGSDVDLANDTEDESSAMDPQESEEDDINQDNAVLRKTKPVDSEAEEMEITEQLIVLSKKAEITHIVSDVERVKSLVSKPKISAEYSLTKVKKVEKQQNNLDLGKVKPNEPGSKGTSQHSTLRTKDDATTQSGNTADSNKTTIESNMRMWCELTERQQSAYLKSLSKRKRKRINAKIRNGCDTFIVNPFQDSDPVAESGPKQQATILEHTLERQKSETCAIQNTSTPSKEIISHSSNDTSSKSENEDKPSVKSQRKVMLWGELDAAQKQAHLDSLPPSKLQSFMSKVDKFGPKTFVKRIQVDKHDSTSDSQAASTEEGTEATPGKKTGDKKKRKHSLSTDDARNQNEAPQTKRILTTKEVTTLKVTTLDDKDNNSDEPVNHMATEKHQTKLSIVFSSNKSKSSGFQDDSQTLSHDVFAQPSSIKDDSVSRKVGISPLKARFRQGPSLSVSESECETPERRVNRAISKLDSFAYNSFQTAKKSDLASDVGETPISDDSNQKVASAKSPINKKEKRVLENKDTPSKDNNAKEAMEEKGLSSNDSPKKKAQFVRLQSQSEDNTTETYNLLEDVFSNVASGEGARPENKMSSAEKTSENRDGTIQKAATFDITEASSEKEVSDDTSLKAVECFENDTSESVRGSQNNTSEADLDKSLIIVSSKTSHSPNKSKARVKTEKNSEQQPKLLSKFEQEKDNGKALNANTEETMDAIGSQTKSCSVQMLYLSPSEQSDDGSNLAGPCVYRKRQLSQQLGASTDSIPSVSTPKSSSSLPTGSWKKVRASQKQTGKSAANMSDNEAKSVIQSPNRSKGAAQLEMSDEDMFASPQKISQRSSDLQNTESEIRPENQSSNEEPIFTVLKSKQISVKDVGNMDMDESLSSILYPSSMDLNSSVDEPEKIPNQAGNRNLHSSSDEESLTQEPNTRRKSKRIRSRSLRSENEAESQAAPNEPSDSSPHDLQIDEPIGEIRMAPQTASNGNQNIKIYDFKDDSLSDSKNHDTNKNVKMRKLDEDTIAEKGKMYNFSDDDKTNKNKRKEKPATPSKNSSDELEEFTGRFMDFQTTTVRRSSRLMNKSHNFHEEATTTEASESETNQESNQECTPPRAPDLARFVMALPGETPNAFSTSQHSDSEPDLAQTENPSEDEAGGSLPRRRSSRRAAGVVLTLPGDTPTVITRHSPAVKTRVSARNTRSRTPVKQVAGEGSGGDHETEMTRLESDATEESVSQERKASPRRRSYNTRTKVSNLAGVTMSHDTSTDQSESHQESSTDHQQDKSMETNDHSSDKTFTNDTSSTDARTSQTDADTSQTNADTSQTDADTSQTDADTSLGDADTSQNDADMQIGSPSTRTRRHSENNRSASGDIAKSSPVVGRTSARYSLRKSPRLSAKKDKISH